MVPGVSMKKINAETPDLQFPIVDQNKVKIYRSSFM